jgi:GT2 family glycosyltransferase
MIQTRGATTVKSSYGDEFLPGPGEPGLVSIIIPTYNRAGLIRLAIDSALAQTYGRIEIIVVDDGSKDNTREVVESYGDPVRYVYKQNGGVAAARNLGFRHARGEFIALLDSDDEWLPWKLEAQVRVLQSHPEVGMVWTDMAAINEPGELLYERYLRIFYDAHALAKLEQICEVSGSVSDVWSEAPAEIANAPVLTGDIFSRIWLGNLVHTSTLLVRRDRLRAAGEIDIEFTPRGEDYEFHVRICSHGPVALLDAPSMLYRIGAPDQLTAPHMGIHTARSNLTTVLRWLERGGSRVTLPARMISNRLAQAYGWVGETEMLFGEWSRARKHLWQSLRYRPSQPRALMLFFFSMLPASAFRKAQQFKRSLRRAWSFSRSMVITGGVGGLLTEESSLAFLFNLGNDLAISGAIPGL